jgi:hypothetical protein
MKVWKGNLTDDDRRELSIPIRLSDLGPLTPPRNPNQLPPHGEYFGYPPTKAAVITLVFAVLPFVIAAFLLWLGVK